MWCSWGVPRTMPGWVHFRGAVEGVGVGVEVDEGVDMALGCMQLPCMQVIVVDKRIIRVWRSIMTFSFFLDSGDFVFQLFAM